MAGQAVDVSMFRNSRTHKPLQAAGQEPELVLVDGFGACHPRCCGSACQFGLAAGARAIGVGKSLNDVPLLREREVKVGFSAAIICQIQRSIT